MSASSPTVKSRTQQLRDLIDDLVAVISTNGGSMQLSDAGTELAKLTGLPQSEVPYIANSAAADNRITADLRSGVLTLVPTGGDHS